MEKELRIIISGGGTGGHIFPAVSIANAIIELRPALLARTMMLFMVSMKALVPSLSDDKKRKSQPFNGSLWFLFSAVT
jgi:hypothetical protein